MANDTFMSKLRSFLGFEVRPPTNEFRNPIWGSDEDDDDDDELYSRHRMEPHSQLDVHREITRQMQEMFSSFGGLFGDMKTFFNDDFKAFFNDDGHSFFDDNDFVGSGPQPPDYNSNSIREFYLKSGYQHHRPSEEKDVDLDGKVSSHEILGLLRKQEEEKRNPNMIVPFDPMNVPVTNFCKTVITTSVTKPDGTIETRKIVRNGKEIIEDTITSSEPGCRGPNCPTGPRLTASSATGILLSDLVSLFSNFH